MGAFLLALIPLLEDAFAAAEDVAALRSLLAGGGGLVALQSISFAQWCAIGADVVGATPKVISAFSALHPALTKLVADLRSGQTVHESAAEIFALFTRNAPAEIPGYLPDGSLGLIPNPDNKES
jgi:hypothetical protein